MSNLSANIVNAKPKSKYPSFLSGMFLPTKLNSMTIFKRYREAMTVSI
ncbi:hypothetical protein MADA3029_60169 [Vibrio nigripulchritudo MADA3029]|nr:hypothetical protein VIBNIMADA3020_290171 [Vibrio nigripulchritudo MADA3020]CCN51065.1 hypothetical protein VIBNIMADA3021_10172 [Vibrio nigripulchritudo MADA3021]CCN60583.1 hypothetical protein MADA3029_60169 [Vibrio nigripulchritudo MADA3029]